MRHILLPPRSYGSISPASISKSATYQTNPNPSEHSKSDLLRLTLVTLWNLRVPPMVRSALIAVLAVAFLASSAAASRLDVARTQSHTSGNKSTVHHTRRSTLAHKTTPHSAKPTGRRSTASRRSHRATRYSTVSRRPVYASRRYAAVRRTVYTHRRLHARFTPVTASISPRENHPRFETDMATPDTRTETTSSERRVEQASTPSSDFRTGSDSPAESGGDTSIPTGADPSSAAAGNPLAAPPAAAPAVPSPSTQVAELHLPRFPQNLHLNSYALRGTHDSLVRQNERSEEEALERIEDDADLHDRIARGMLVHVPESVALSVNPELPDDRRYCRPWTAEFLTALSRAHNSVFHKPLVVSSAVRTVEYQKYLMRVNHNAADAEGDIVSPHITGATIDIAKSGLSRKEMQWMRSRLLAYQDAGVIDVEEEFRQRCFHITVYKSYDSLVQPGHEPKRADTAPEVPSTVPADVSKDE